MSSDNYFIMSNLSNLYPRRRAFGHSAVKAVLYVAHHKVGVQSAAVVDIYPPHCFHHCAASTASPDVLLMRLRNNKNNNK